MDREFKIGWCWRDVRIFGATLSRLFKENYLDNVFRSNSRTGYRLSEKGKQVVESCKNDNMLEVANEPDTGTITVPEDLFGDIIGHKDVKELLRACLLAEQPVHVLLTGPPALAKTVFLWDIERLFKEKALWLLGSATSKAGLWDILAERKPEVLLVDELDKAEASDQAALLSVTEGGRVVRAKVGRELDLKNPLRVVATSNRMEKLSPELRSRFAIRRLNPYSREEYLEVVRGVLITRENTSPEVSDQIARALDGRSQNVRDAIRVARLAPQLGVAKAVKLLLEQI
jgi:holliday junction DNA helicase RuvB